MASADLASEIMFGMKTRQVLVAITGKQSNIILLTPPLCFTMENCRLLVAALEEVIAIIISIISSFISTLSIISNIYNIYRC